MIQVIHGKKGSGKTKKILDMANAAVDQYKGDIIFVDDDNRYMFDLKHEVRFVNAGEYGSDSPEMFFGFLCGMLSQNFDINVILIDNIYFIFPLKPNIFTFSWFTASIDS